MVSKDSTSNLRQKRIIDSISNHILNTNLFPNEEISNLIKKYEDFINNKEFYSMLLQIKTKLRREFKLIDKIQSITLLSFAVGKIFSENEQFEALSDFIKFLINEFSKLSLSNDSHKEVLEYIIELIKYLYVSLPKKDFVKEDLQNHILELFIKIFKLSQFEIKSKFIYRIFSEDCLLNDNPIKSYKYAMNDESLDLILLFIDLHLEETNNQNENLHIIVRIIIEMLVKNNLLQAKKILFTKAMTHSLNNQANIKLIHTNKEGYLKNSHALVNFSLLLISIIQNSLPFEKLQSLFNEYKNWLQNDSKLDLYLNNLSFKYYNTYLFDQGRGNNNIFNILNNFL